MRYFFLIALALTIFACSKVTLNQVIVPVNGKYIQHTNATILADSTTLDTITVTINGQADSNKRNVLFTTSAGTFIGNKDSNLVSVRALYAGNAQLTATVILRAPLSPCTIYITAIPDVQSPLNTYMVYDTITARASIAANLSLQPSSFGISSSFGNEILITGNLSNAENNFVSRGVFVKIRDSVLLPSPGTAIHGFFRLTDSLSNGLSQVSTNYSIDSELPTGTQIMIIADTKDTSVNHNSPSASITLTVIK